MNEYVIHADQVSDRKPRQIRDDSREIHGQPVEARI